MSLRHVDMSQRGPSLRRAFTLIEILIVLVLIVLLVAVAWPVLDGQVTASELPESAARMRDMLYMTRSASMLEHRRHRVRFAPGAQQPVVEVEIDPIFQPGVWTPVAYPWAREKFLLAEVQVNAIQPGRPSYLRPVSINDDPDSKENKDAEQQELILDIGVTDGQQIGSIGVASANDDAEFDPERPTIVFETDGSSDWATIIVSHLELGQALDDEIPQKWVILDGRTGLATIRDQVTQEDLSDPEFFVQREKLELPDVVTPDDLTLNVSTDEAGNVLDPGMGTPQGGSSTGQPGVPPLPGGDAILPELPDGAGVPPGSVPPVPAQPQLPEMDEDAQLEEGLEDSDLTDEEREKIRRALQGGGPR